MNIHENILHMRRSEADDFAKKVTNSRINVKIRVRIGGHMLLIIASRCLLGRWCNYINQKGEKNYRT